MATRLVKSDTIAAVRTIQTILESVDDHGVIDVFKKYPMQDSIASIYALSRLQAATEFFYRSQPGSKSGGSNTPAAEAFPILDDEALLEELNHYAPYASATYGWKLDLATAGRLHRGDLHALTRITQIRSEDVVMVEWESRPHRPVSACRRSLAYFFIRLELNLETLVRHSILFEIESENALFWRFEERGVHMIY